MATERRFNAGFRAWNNLSHAASYVSNRLEDLNPRYYGPGNGRLVTYFNGLSFAAEHSHVGEMCIVKQRTR